MNTQRFHQYILWGVRILLLFWNSTGALYMMTNYPSLTHSWALKFMPEIFWISLGMTQILFSIGLVFPGQKIQLKNITAVSAFILAVISLMGLGLYVSYSGFPGMLWAIIPAAIAAFIGVFTARTTEDKNA